MSASPTDHASTRSAAELTNLLCSGGLHSHFQPIIELATERVVACEALARGPVGSPFESPAALFDTARAHSLLADLDDACRTAALRGAVEHGLTEPLTLFVDVEPEVLESAPLGALLQIAASAPGHLRVVVELTERALAHRPAELLCTVDRIREAGWAVALDDVGAEPMSLNAVNAYAEDSGAVVLAEGIEDERHLRLALALGASLEQGWQFGRPQPGPVAEQATGSLRLPPPAPLTTASALMSPFASSPRALS